MPKNKSLKTYLKVYCQNLSDSKDYRLSSFYRNFNNNHRLEGPLFLYTAMFYPNELYVKKYLSKEYQIILEDIVTIVQQTKDLNEMVKNLPYEESKALQSYLTYCKDNSSNNDSKKAYLIRIKELIKDNISKYRICKDNNINPGNFHAFLNGSLDKISLNKCDQIYDYLINN